MTHPSHNMHPNSLEAYSSERMRLSARAKRIYDWVFFNGPATDREIMRGLNYIDMGMVRPRLTELVQDGLLEEMEQKVRCPVTHKSVRQVRVKATSPQMELV